MAARQRRLRSSGVVLGGMGMLALTLTACGSDPDKRCVDRVTHEKLPKYECDDDNGRGGYYYGGSFKNGKAQGGSFDKSAVDRGGFGHSGSGGG
ncbi:hypothetical protein OG349_13695 [Streptomyces sp. NBC_01317]|uniref:hypothetical protein n=1 Tax=Streptomyces sp. NBC_01317 TaxID=2903822 RepID=UPI002E0D8E9B|nr:hypothetical protein OG349_13695 [Streptomyces sp. NBC_01317]